MKKTKKNKGENFLEFIPIKSNKIDWGIDEKGLVKLTIWRNSQLDKFVRKLFKTPEKTVIDLDEQGSNAWENINGENNIYDIVELQRERFGKEAEPAVERLLTYIKILKNNDFIFFHKK